MGKVRLLNGGVRPTLEVAAGQVERWRLVNVSSARYVNFSLGGLPSRRRSACRRGEPAMTMHASTIDSIGRSLVGLRMPRALEALDATLRRIEQGEVDGIEAFDQLKQRFPRSTPRIV
jgi:FtsP/CotA-like multicopper oxidase with cupredoxin domain